MNEYVHASTSEACMHVDAWACVRKCLCGCEKWLGVRLSVYSSLNPALHWHVFKHIYLNVVVLSACPSVHLSVSLYACLCASFYVQLSVLLPSLLYASVNVYFSVWTWVSVGKGKTTCLPFYLIVNPSIHTNVTIQFCVCFSPSVYRIVYCLSMCPSVC